MIITFDSRKIEDYRTFLAVKRLPRYRFIGNTAEFPDEYADRLGLSAKQAPVAEYEPIPGLFDYQRDIARLALKKRKFSVFADCGLGKTAIFLEYARHVASVLPPGQCVLIISPLMVIHQTLAEADKFYGDSLPIRQVRAAELPGWLASGTDRIGITNYEALTDDLRPGRVGAIIVDESSILKSHYGAWGSRILELGKGLEWKLCCTGTPAPNDRIEYATHAVFMDAFPTINAFLARYFVNRGQTMERWELKPHALGPFYRSLSHWCVFLTNPATYRWKDNATNIPPIHTHIHDIPMTDEQRGLVQDKLGTLFVGNVGGIGSRGRLSQIAKGRNEGRKIDTRKPEYIRQLVESWPEESTIIWCLYNHEQDLMEEMFPDAASIRGETPYERRVELVEDFKAGRRRVLISKSKVLGFGLNLHIATRMVFSGLQDSYESFYQAVKRANRVGSTRPLNVHIPITEAERPMIETVLLKAKRVQQDTEEQERIFRTESANVA